MVKELLKLIYMEQKILNIFKIISKVILFMLMFILIISLLLGTINLIINLIGSIVQEKPYYLVDIKDLYPVFNLILIIIVGIELLKSMTYILDHTRIPYRTILQIAIMAVANKIITLDIKSEGMNTMIGLGVLVLTIAVALLIPSGLRIKK